MAFSGQSFGTRDDNSKCCISTGTNLFSTDTHYQKDKIKYNKDIWGVFSILGFILGICAVLLFFIPIFGLVVAVISLIFGILGIKSMLKKRIIYLVLALNFLSIASNILFIIL